MRELSLPACAKGDPKEEPANPREDAMVATATACAQGPGDRELRPPLPSCCPDCGSNQREGVRSWDRRAPAVRSERLPKLPRRRH